MNINIGVDFSRSPSGRTARDGPHNGTTFREKHLKRAVKLSQSANEKLTIKLDDAEGYGSSFLDEAFGGLVRKGYIEPETLIKLLKFEYTNQEYEFYEKRINTYIRSSKYGVDR